MPKPLLVAHQNFVAAIRRDTPGTDLPRLVAVLDALLEWSAARRKRITFRTDEKRCDVISFGRVGSKVAMWSAQVTMGEGPRLELFAPADTAEGRETRASVMATLNACSREVLVDGDRLRISFSALKNEAGRAAVLSLMDRLLVSTRRPAALSA